MSFDILNGAETPISEYAYFFRKPNQQYAYKGMCKSLDMDDYKDRLNDNKEIFEEGMACSSIMLYRKQCVEVGSVNIDRVKRLFARSIDTIIIH